MAENTSTIQQDCDCLSDKLARGAKATGRGVVAGSKAVVRTDIADIGTGVATGVVVAGKGVVGTTKAVGRFLNRGRQVVHNRAVEVASRDTRIDRTIARKEAKLDKTKAELAAARKARREFDKANTVTVVSKAPASKSTSAATA